MRTRLIEPMQLTHTATLPEDVLRYRAAIGHIEPPGHERTTAPMWGLPRTAGPPGGVCSTATEVVRFAQLHLEGGTLGDAQIVSADGVQAMQVPQIAVPSGGDGLSSRDWGLGWSIFEWGGRTVLGHDGGTIGQAAFLRVVPDCGCRDRAAHERRQSDRALPRALRRAPARDRRRRDARRCRAAGAAATGRPVRVCRRLRARGRVDSRAGEGRRPRRGADDNRARLRADAGSDRVPASTRRPRATTCSSLSIRPRRACGCRFAS